MWTPAMLQAAVQHWKARQVLEMPAPGGISILLPVAGAARCHWMFPRESVRTDSPRAALDSWPVPGQGRLKQRRAHACSDTTDTHTVVIHIHTRTIHMTQHTHAHRISPFHDYNTHLKLYYRFASLCFHRKTPFRCSLETLLLDSHKSCHLS